jgi:hypothetical protein
MRATREELFEQVWREPITRVALHHGVSDVAIAKTCRALDVSAPPRGHWAELKYGKASPQPPLSHAGPNAA